MDTLWELQTSTLSKPESRTPAAAGPTAHPAAGGTWGFLNFLLADPESQIDQLPADRQTEPQQVTANRGSPEGSRRNTGGGFLNFLLNDPSSAFYGSGSFVDGAQQVDTTHGHTNAAAPEQTARQGDATNAAAPTLQLWSPLANFAEGLLNTLEGGGGDDARVASQELELAELRLKVRQLQLDLQYVLSENAHHLERERLLEAEIRRLGGTVPADPHALPVVSSFATIPTTTPTTTVPASPHTPTSPPTTEPTSLVSATPSPKPGTPPLPSAEELKSDAEEGWVLDL